MNYCQNINLFGHYAINNSIINPSIYIKSNGVAGRLYIGSIDSKNDIVFKEFIIKNLALSYTMIYASGIKRFNSSE